MNAEEIIEISSDESEVDEIVQGKRCVYNLTSDDAEKTPTLTCELLSHRSKRSILKTQLRASLPPSKMAMASLSPSAIASVKPYTHPPTEPFGELCEQACVMP
jgi:hypothetical protein